MKARVMNYEGSVSAAIYVPGQRAIRFGCTKFWRFRAGQSGVSQWTVTQGFTYRPVPWVYHDVLSQPWVSDPLEVCFEFTQIRLGWFGIEWILPVRGEILGDQFGRRFSLYNLCHKGRMWYPWLIAVLALGASPLRADAPAELAFRNVPDFHPAVFMAVVLAFLLLMFAFTLGGGGRGNRRR